MTDTVINCNVCGDPLPHDRCGPVGAGDGHIKGPHVSNWSGYEEIEVDVPRAVADFLIPPTAPQDSVGGGEMAGGQNPYVSDPKTAWEHPDNPWPKVERMEAALTAIRQKILTEKEDTGDQCRATLAAIDKLCDEGLGE